MQPGAPDASQGTLVDAPLVLGGPGLDLVETLRVGDDLGGKKRLAHVLDERSPGLVRLDDERRRVTRERLPGCALGGLGGRAAREGRLADRGDGDGQVEGGLHRPLTGALL